ncbi:hypothetical protein SLS56_000356 [Neofusicoccum ribis]|uniref:Uncharacterized protein n=1 Tax=Neofusicoccum ribis TaxID=45134 RepID=A0ABR3TEM1_9PEZI
MQFTTVATILAGAAAVAAAPTPSTLQSFNVEGLKWSTTPSQTQVSFDFNDPNSGIKTNCYWSPVLIGGVYTCNNNDNVKYAFNDDMTQMSVAVTFPKGTLDDSDAYYIANGTAVTAKTCQGTTAGQDCQGAPHIFLTINEIQGVA